MLSTGPVGFWGCFSGEMHHRNIYLIITLIIIYESKVPEVWVYMGYKEHPCLCFLPVLLCEDQDSGVQGGIKLDADPDLKRCTKCGEEKPLNEFPSTKRDGVLHQCKTCMREYYRSRYHQRPDVRARMQEYYKRPEVKERYRERYWKQGIRDRKMEYYQRPDVQERRKTAREEYRQRPEVEERDKQWRKDHWRRPDVQERRRWYRQRPDVKEHERLYAEEYRKRPGAKERLKEYSKTPQAKFLKINREHKRRIQKIHAIAATDEPITPQQWATILKQQKNKCPDCGKRFTKKNPPTMDHIVPLSLIPLHSSDNIRAVCGGCNARKRDRVVQEYIQVWLYTSPPTNL